MPALLTMTQREFAAFVRFFHKIAGENSFQQAAIRFRITERVTRLGLTFNRARRSDSVMVSTKSNRPFLLVDTGKPRLRESTTRRRRISSKITAELEIVLVFRHGAPIALYIKH
jgi:hypothetical protein